MNKVNNIDISIIVPVYNAEKYIERCLISLINQSKKNIEIILINDGSSDDSEKIIKKFDDSRIKYFKQSNKGIGKTRNRGIDESHGKYIMFVDSDDYLPINSCEIFWNHAKEELSDLIVSDYYKDSNGNITTIKLDSFKASSLHDDGSLLLKINLGPCNKIYSSKLIKNNNIYFNEDYKYEDVPFVLECIKYANQISKIDEPLSYYYIHSGSETTTRNERIFDIIKIVDLSREIISDKCLKEYMDVLTVEILVNYTIQQRYQKDKKLRNRFIDECFSYLKKNIGDYKNKKYYSGKGFIRRKIESSAFLTKLYCSIAHLKYR